MPCRNAGPHLDAAVQSVLGQPECRELLVADGGSSDGSLQRLEALAAENPRLRIVSRRDHGVADGLNTALRAAQGPLIGWLNADDLYTPGALARACAALAAQPQWLMVYGEGEEFQANGIGQRYPTLPPACGLEGFRSHCFICQPTVVFRRALALLLGPFDERWRTAFDFDYWLRAFAAFPQRIGYLPHLQARTRLHPATITSQQRAAVALEATALLARHFGPGPTARLHSYAIELQLGIAQLPPDVSFTDHLSQLAAQASAHLEPSALARFRSHWLLDPATAPAASQAEHKAAASGLHRQLPIRLLQAVHPKLAIDGAGPPAGPHRRLQRAQAKFAPSYPLLRNLTAESLPAASLTPFAQRPFGVNLIGHAFEPFGIAEDLRMAARALQAADVPCCVIDYPAANGAPRTDASLEPLLHHDPKGGPFAFNLVCMAAPIQARWLLEGGLDPLRERYTLAAWPWETQQWPDLWWPLLEVVDELWPASSLIAEALSAPARQLGLPLQLMPMAADIGDPRPYTAAQTRQASRARYGLPSQAVLFTYSFDLNSTAIRKNPLGVLEAFQRAFPLPNLPTSFGCPERSHPLSDRVALLIKAFLPTRFSPEWQWLQLRAAEDPRIHLLADNLERHELLALNGCCDVFVSLHRSEGFGRGIAEALQLGLDVIATDFGGNTDFCHGPLAHPVRYQLVPIPRHAYAHADGHTWAEPNLDHALALMRQIAARRCDGALQPLSAVNPAAHDSYRQQFSCAAAGVRYRTRLLELWQRRHQLRPA